MYNRLSGGFYTARTLLLEFTEYAHGLLADPEGSVYLHGLGLASVAACVVVLALFIVLSLARTAAGTVQCAYRGVVRRDE